MYECDELVYYGACVSLCRYTVNLLCVGKEYEYFAINFELKNCAINF